MRKLRWHWALPLRAGRARLGCPVGILVLFFASTSHADLIFNLTPATQLGSRSNTVIVTGTLSNNSATDNLYVNDIQFAFSGAATNFLSGGANEFFANVPGVLLPGETYSNAVCAIAIAANTPAGDYHGSISIAGGSNIFAVFILATQDIQVSVFETPFEAWRFKEFGTDTNNPAISGAVADPDNDGIVNLLEYAFNLDPHVGNLAGFPVPQLDVECGCLTLTYAKAIGAVDLNFTPEAAHDPGGPWGTNGVMETILDADTEVQTIKASDTFYPVATSTNRFMHLRVTPIP